jgi:hypothetical protein
MTPDEKIDKKLGEIIFALRVQTFALGAIIGLLLVGRHNDLHRSRRERAHIR